MKKKHKKSKYRNILVISLALILVAMLIYISTSTTNQTLEDKNSGIDNSDETDEIKPNETLYKKISSSSYKYIYSATSTDAVNWTPNEEVIFERASVPSAVLFNGKIYLYFIDYNEGNYQLSVGISSNNGGTFEKADITFDQMATSDATDPSAEVVDNKIKLYYLGFVQTTPFKDKNQIYSSTSEDGITFSEPVLAIEEPDLTDADTYYYNENWYMLINANRAQGQIYAESYDNGVTFKSVFETLLENGGSCDTNLINGKLLTYCNHVNSISILHGLEEQKLEYLHDPVLEDEDYNLADPSVLQLPDGTYLMFYTKLKKYL